VNNLDELVGVLSDLDSAPGLIKRRKNRLLKKFKWTRSAQVNELLLLGVWLDLINCGDSSDSVFLFMSTCEFEGDWTIWGGVQAALLMLSLSTRRQENDSSYFTKCALAHGFIRDRLIGSLLETQVRNLRNSPSEDPFFADQICYQIEGIIVELRVIRALGGSEKYDLKSLQAMEENYQAQLLETATRVEKSGTLWKRETECGR